MAAAAAIPFISPVTSLLQNILNFQSTGRAAGAISNANDSAMHGVLGAAAGGQTGVSDAARMGIQGVEGAVASGQQGVNERFGEANTNLNAAGGQAIGAVNNATGTANAGLTEMLGTQTAAINPYLNAGNTGLTNLTAMAGGPGFKFNYDDYKNDPAFQFQMDQGQRAIQNSGSARGLGSSGATLKELTNFGQGMAATHYGEAFNRAKQSFDTNQTAGFQNNTALIDAGARGLNEFGRATTNAGNQIAGNTINAGKYEGDTTQSITGLLASLGIDAGKFNSATGLTGALANSNTGLTAATTNSNTGLRAAGMAGDYNVASGTSRAAGITGQGADVNAGLGGLGDILSLLLGKKN